MNSFTDELLLDKSTPNDFVFSICCALCGDQRNSKPVRFSKSGLIPDSVGKKIVFDALKRREKIAAEERAKNELMSQFSLCPICGRMVCDHCFLVCDDLDMCMSCAAALHETGEPVAQRIEQLAI